MNEKFEKYFESRIIERGNEYFENGQVHFFKQVGLKYTAEVLGTRPYQVEIEMNGNRKPTMKCDCAYAFGGNNCKHMVAVLDEIERYQFQKNGISPKKDSNSQLNSEFLVFVRKYQNRKLSFMDHRNFHDYVYKYLNKIKSKTRSTPEFHQQEFFEFLKILMSINDDDYYGTKSIYDLITQIIKLYRNTEYFDTAIAIVLETLQATNNRPLFVNYVKLLSEISNKKLCEQMFNIIEGISDSELASLFNTTLIQMMKKSFYDLNEIYDRFISYKLDYSTHLSMIEFYEKNEELAKCNKVILLALQSDKIPYYDERNLLDKLEKNARKIKDVEAYSYVLNRSVRYGYVNTTYLGRFKRLFDKKDWEVQKQSYFDTWKQKWDFSAFKNALKYFDEFDYIVNYLTSNFDYNFFIDCFEDIYKFDPFLALSLLNNYIMMTFEKYSTNEYYLYRYTNNYFSLLAKYTRSIKSIDELFVRLREKYKNQNKIMKLIESIESEVESHV